MRTASLHRAVLDSLQAYVAVLDRRGVIVDVNAAWRRFAQEGDTAGLIGAPIGTNYLALCEAVNALRDGDARDTRAGIEAVLHGTGAPFAREYALPSEAGPRRFQLAVAPLPPGIGGAVVSHTDITPHAGDRISPDRVAEAELLNAITTAAAGEDDPGRMLAVTLRLLRGRVPFTGGSIALVEDGGLVIRAAEGRFAATALGQRLPQGQGRLWRVIEEREPFLSRDLIAEGFQPTTPVRSYLAVPLVWRGRAFGVLEVDSTRPDAFTADDAALLQKVAVALSGPIQLARRYTAEAQALHEAQEAQRRLRLIVEAGAALSSSLDYEETLERIVRFAVPELADWCSVNLLQDDGTIAHVAVAHADPAKEPLLDELRRRYPPDQHSRHPVAEALREGRSTLFAEVTDEFLASFARDTGHLDLIRALAPRSVMVVPLVVRGRFLGAITFASAESGRRYGEQDLAVAEAITHRAAVAVDNARTHHELEEALAERDRALAEARYERERLNNLLMQAPAMIAYLRGPQCVFEFANTMYRRSVGDREIIGRPVREALPELEGQGYFELLDQVYTSGEPFEGSEMPVAVGRGDGRLVEGFYNLVFQPTRDAWGVVDGILVHATDVTEQVLARREVEAKTEEIQRLNEELEQRVIERTAQLEATNKELESFSYSVSHDLRAPLRSIDGFSQALLEDYAHRLDAEGHDYLNRVRAATRRMAQLIDDLLNLSRVTRAELHREPVDLSEIAREVAADLRKAAPERDVTFVIEDGIVANGDARLLRVVLENLLGNAWKFTAKQADARIEFGATRQDDERVYFVRDNGAGFEMAYRDKLFAPFQRLHATSEFEGSGVGLATVQRIVRRHGGRIWAEGAVNQGATFFFTL